MKIKLSNIPAKTSRVASIKSCRVAFGMGLSDASKIISTIPEGGSVCFEAPEKYSFREIVEAVNFIHSKNKSNIKVEKVFELGNLEHVLQNLVNSISVRGIQTGDWPEYRKACETLLDKSQSF